MALVIATETIFVATKGGTPRTIVAGAALDDADPIVKANPRSFSTPEAIADAAVPPTFSPVEQATAAPGERRTVRQP